MGFLEFLIQWLERIAATAVVVITVAGIVYAVKYWRS